MKPVHLILPLIALLLAGGILGIQHQELNHLEINNEVLRAHLAAVKKESAASPGEAGNLKISVAGKSSEPIDWVEMARFFLVMDKTGGPTDMRRLLLFQSRLQKMTEEELLDSLEQVAGLDITLEEREVLELLVIDPLGMKNPELALKRFSNRIGDDFGAFEWQLANIFGRWGEKDSAAATAWLDQEIAKGAFESKSLDGRSQSRMNFESKLIARLVSSDLPEAGRRLAVLPADQRKDVLGSSDYSTVEEADQAAYAGLVRSQLSAEDQVKVLGEHASSIAMDGGLAKVGEYFERISATPDERMQGAG